MITKLRVVITMVYEYKAKPRDYPEDCRTPEKMLAADIENAEHSPGDWTNAMEPIDVRVTGEVLSK